jgi:hypothetical protein
MKAYRKMIGDFTEEKISTENSLKTKGLENDSIFAQLGAQASSVHSFLQP